MREIFVCVLILSKNNNQWRPLWAKEMATVIPEFESGVFVFLGASSDLLSRKHHIFWISMKKRFFWCIAYQAPRTSNMFSKSKNFCSDLALFTSLWQSFFVNSLKLLSFEKFRIKGINQLTFIYLLEPLWIYSVRTSFWLDLPIVRSSHNNFNKIICYN